MLHICWESSSGLLLPALRLGHCVRVELRAAVMLRADLTYLVCSTVAMS